MSGENSTCSDECRILICGTVVVKITWDYLDSQNLPKYCNATSTSSTM